MSVYETPKRTLKPCPFCGSTDLSICMDYGTYKSDIIQRHVECGGCRAEGPSDWLDKDCTFDPIKKWNTRGKDE